MSGSAPAPSPYLRADIQRCDGPPGTPWTTVDRGKYLTEEPTGA